MEDFLNQISQRFIQERIQRLKDHIETQRKATIKKIYGYRRQLSTILNTKIHKKPSIQSMQNADQVRNVSSLNRASESKDIPFIQLSREFNSQQVGSKHLDTKQSQNCFLLFQKACQNILNTYFPLLMEDEFLSLQSQEYEIMQLRQINEKLSYLNNLIEKTAVNLIKKLTKADCFSKQAQKDEVDRDQMNEQSSIQISCSQQQKTKKIKKRKNAKEQLMKKKGKNTKIPHQSTYVMQKWLLQNFNDPYPNLQQKQRMAHESGLTVYQVNNWFINARQRVIKKFLKKDNSSAQVTGRNSRVWEEDEDLVDVKKQKPVRKRKESKSHLSEHSVRLSKSHEEKEEIDEE